MTTELLGNNNLLKTLTAWTESGRFPHAVLVDGPLGSGKTHFAKMLAKNILCTGEKPPCNQCSSCMKVDRNIHPDFHILQGEGGPRSFHIRQIRELREEAWTFPNDGDRKVFLLEKSEEMTLGAQNALLKIMEDPPPGVYLILTCENHNLLLTTIRSRGTMLTLDIPDKAESMTYLTARFPEKPQATLENALASGGSIGRAIEIVLVEEETSFPSLSKDLWKKLKEKNQLSAMEITGKLERDKEGFGKLLESLETEVTRELLSQSEKEGGRLSNLQLARIVDIIEDIQNALDGNSNMLLLVTILPGKIGEVVASR